MLSRGRNNVRPNWIPAIVAAFWFISKWPGFQLADSVPFNLDLHGKNTYVGKQMAQDGVVQVSGGSGSNQKRFGTLHVFYNKVAWNTKECCEEILIKSISTLKSFKTKNALAAHEKNHIAPAVDLGDIW